MQFLGWFYTPVVVQWQARLVQTAQSGGAAGAIPAVVGVAVLMQRQGGVSCTVEVSQIRRAV